MENNHFERSIEISRIIRKDVQKLPLSPEEIAILETWLHEKQIFRNIYAGLKNEEDLSLDLKRFYLTNTAKQLLLVGRRMKKRKKIRQLQRWISAAAIVIITTIGTMWWLNGDKLMKSSITTDQSTSKVMDIILPGANRALLQLSSGLNIQLSEQESGIINKDEGMIYAGGTKLGDFNGATFATLSTPKGGEYAMILPDGTSVKLNATSSITYPTRFSGNTREVEIYGEVYFEVAPDIKHPFIVNTQHQKIEVLGTHFNVNAYPDTKFSYTTLAEGKVRLTGSNDSQTVTLIPGQQSTIFAGKNVSVKKVDTAAVLAWTTGKFSFTDKSFDEVMQELGRWYDLDIVYVGTIPKTTFFGGAFRNSELSFVLELLESAEVDYKIKGRQLLIINHK